MAAEDQEIYTRLSRLEQEIHTLKYRAETLDSHNLPIRVANLEPVVKNIGSDVAKIEASTEKLADAVHSMKSWGLGFVAALSCIIVILTTLPLLKGLLP